MLYGNSLGNQSRPEAISGHNLLLFSAYHGDRRVLGGEGQGEIWAGGIFWIVMRALSDESDTST